MALLKDWDIRINCNYLLVVIPKDVGRRFGAELYSASEIYGAAFINVKVRTSQDGGRWHWRRHTEKDRKKGEEK